MRRPFLNKTDLIFKRLRSLEKDMHALNRWARMSHLPSIQRLAVCSKELIQETMTELMGLRSMIDRERKE